MTGQSEWDVIYLELVVYLTRDLPQLQYSLSETCELGELTTRKILLLCVCTPRGKAEDYNVFAATLN